MKRVLLILLALNALFFLFGLNIRQENPEELFLSDSSMREFKEFQKEFGEQEVVFVSGLKEEQTLDIMDFAESKGGEFSPLSPVIKGAAILKVPKLSDSDRFHYFKTFEEHFPELRFAGETFTNAHLAGMSIKIQKVLFPVIFGLIFLGLLFLTRNYFASVYLFTSSLLGVGVGLSTIKVLYNHSTILTTLTPLIAFVLTLGVQLHVVYGLGHYQKKETFFKKKLRPLLIMMITTLIGFFGLITSDLEAIRQLSVTATLSLAITWGILLLLLKLYPANVEVTPPSFIQGKLRIPKGSRILGSSILVFLLAGGTYGFLKMSVMVEAIEFFSPEHQVQKGFLQIKKDLGGTPQFEIIISRKDKAPLAFEDLIIINEYEKELEKSFPGNKMISTNSLVELINAEYSGSKTLPDNSYAYEALLSKIPFILSKLQSSEKVYRISYVSPIMSSEMRKEIEGKLQATFGKMAKPYDIKLGGLTHLLLQSQSHLVSSLITSFLISFVFVVIVFAFFSRDIHEVFIFSILNFSSILGGILLMWLTGMSLNVSSIMTVSISMGLVVDSTVHLLFAEKMKEKREDLLVTTYTPIVLGHILLFFAFMALSLENFVPIRDFSLGLVMLLFVGLICDLYLLPMIVNKEQ